MRVQIISLINSSMDANIYRSCMTNAQREKINGEKKKVGGGGGGGGGGRNERKKEKTTVNVSSTEIWRLKRNRTWIWRDNANIRRVSVFLRMEAPIGVSCDNCYSCSYSAHNFTHRAWETDTHRRATRRTERRVDGRRDGWTDRQTGARTDRQTDERESERASGRASERERERERQADRQTETETKTEFGSM